MTQHTPGPWFAHNIGLGPNGEGPFTYPLGNDPDKAAANARLIAAAPDMLAALKALHAAHRAFSGSEDWGVYDDEARAAAEAAIAKAEEA
jgi:hypothetical protein